MIFFSHQYILEYVYQSEKYNLLVKNSGNIPVTFPPLLKAAFPMIPSKPKLLPPQKILT